MFRQLVTKPSRQNMSRSFSALGIDWGTFFFPEHVAMAARAVKQSNESSAVFFLRSLVLTARVSG
jgi:hypothetical protein